MSNNIVLNPGSGGSTVCCTDLTSFTGYSTTGELPASAVYCGATPAPVSASNPFPVAQQGTMTVSGTVTANAGTGTMAVSAASLPLPTGAATAAKQAAPGTAGTASADVLSVQGIAGMTALKVDASATTQPVSGTVTANAGSGTFAVQDAADGPVTPGTVATKSLLIGGQYNTSAPTLTAAQQAALQVDSSGNLKVNVAAGGASGGTSSSFGSAFPATGTALGAKDSSGTNMAALNLDASGFLKVNVAAGGGSGGTSSSFAAAVPATGTAAGFSDGTNMQLARVFDADSGAGTQYVLGAYLRKPASGGSVDFGTNTDPVRVDPTGTTTQPVSGTVTANAGTGTMAVSAASLPLPTGAATAAKQPALGTAGTASADVLTVQGIASMTALKVDGSATTQPVSGTVTANIGTAGTLALDTSVNGVLLAQASTTSGQKGPLIQGAVTTAAPSYTTAQTSPLSLTTAGALRVDNSAQTQPVSAASLPLPAGAATAAKQPALGTAGSASADVLSVQGVASMTALKVDGSAVTQPVSGTVTANQGGTWTVQPGNTANTTPWLATPSPAASGGPTVNRIKAAATTNATSVKASAGQVYGWALYNNTATAKFFKLYNKASAPTVGTDAPLFTVMIPANGGTNLEFSMGLPFGTGIAYAITGAITDADTTATAADDVHGVLLTK